MPEMLVGGTGVHGEQVCSKPHDHTANSIAAVAMLWFENLPSDVLKPSMVVGAYTDGTMANPDAANQKKSAQYLSASKARRSLSRASL